MYSETWNGEKFMNKEFEVGDLLQYKHADVGDLFLILEICECRYKYANISYFLKEGKIHIGTHPFALEQWKKVNE